MRSFASVLLNVLATENHTIQFLDEPEAFLHPPQARLLGEFIARERRAQSQLFIATHSTDVLEGLIAGGSNNVRIVRIQRRGNVNQVKELSREKTASIATDTLTKYSGVFSGIFYKHVIVAESDSDCLFYSSLLNTKVISGEHHPDVLFIHAAGKHRMANLVETLRALDVPVSVVTDVDILTEGATFRRLFEKLGGDWADVNVRWEAIKKSVEALRPPLGADRVKSLIEKELNAISGIDPFPKQAEKSIKRIFKEQSPWDFVKRAGRSGFRGSAVREFDELSRICKTLGLWIVPEGELEGFCRGIQAPHGPAFVERVLEERDLETDEELEAARKFVKEIWRSTGEYKQ